MSKESESIWGNYPNGEPCRIPVMGIVGGIGSGKTLLASTIDPERTTIIDLEDSSKTFSLPYKKRFSLFEAIGCQDTVPPPIEVFKYVENCLKSDDIKGSSVVVIDPASDFTQGLFDYVMADLPRFGISAGQAEKMTGIVWGKANSYLKTMLGMTAQRTGVQTLVFCLHTGTVWKDSRPTNKKKAKGASTYYELASLVLWLEREADKKIPDAITVQPYGKSRLAVSQKDKNGDWITTPCFPPKIAECTPSVIRKFIANPPDFKRLKVKEKFVEKPMTEEEKLALRAETAQAEAETERLKLERMDRTQQAYQAVATVTTQGTEGATVEVTGKPRDPTHPDADNGPSEAVVLAVGPLTEEQMDTLLGLYKQCEVPKEQWQQVLHGYGVQTARDLRYDDAEQLIVYLQKMAEDRNGEAEREQFASAMPGKSSS